MPEKCGRKEEKLRLAVLDPGLLESAGHHAGFATTISASFYRYRSSFEVVFFANKNIEDKLAVRLKVSGIKVEHVFDSAFYQFFEKPGNLITRKEYIYKLSLEYLEVFKYLDVYWGGKGGSLLYHTMSWEHAMSLSLAIDLYGADGARLDHHVLLMFSPGVDGEGEVYNLHRSLNYRGAFIGLGRNANVALFASCHEYAEAYAVLLEYADPLPIHPCFLADWGGGKNAEIAESNISYKFDSGVAKVLLYMGDAKVEKGFLRLPEIVKEWQLVLGSDGVMLVYFTSYWPDSEILRVVRQLKLMASEDSRLHIREKFLSEHELHQVFRDIDLCVLSYESSAYEHKTSGILWFLGFYQIPLVCYGEGWLARESKRLLSRYVVLDEYSITSDQLTELNQDKQVACNASYRKRIYRSFWKWMKLDYRTYE